MQRGQAERVQARGERRDAQPHQRRRRQDWRDRARAPARCERHRAHRGGRRCGPGRRADAAGAV
eukprot:1165919-Prymnesium_polylepis.1